MKTLPHIACLLIGVGAGFVPGTWRGPLITLQANAPGVDPSYADANSQVAVYRTRAKITVGR